MLQLVMVSFTYRKRDRTKNKMVHTYNKPCYGINSIKASIYPKIIKNFKNNGKLLTLTIRKSNNNGTLLNTVMIQ